MPPMSGSGGDWGEAAWGVLNRLGFVGGLAALAIAAAVAVGEAAFDPCSGDCNGDYRVSVSELIQGVNVALDVAPSSICPAIDGDADGRVTIGELVRAAGNALNVCPCPFDFAEPSLQVGIACVYAGSWSDSCGDGTLQATYAGDGSSLGVALIVGGETPPVAFLSLVESPLVATLFGYTIGDASKALSGTVTLAESRRGLDITPDGPSDLVIRDCLFTAYSGRLVDVVKLP